jgi:hypothetical protein
MQGALRKKVPFCGKYVRAAGRGIGGRVGLVVPSGRFFPLPFLAFLSPYIPMALPERVSWRASSTGSKLIKGSNVYCNSLVVRLVVCWLLGALSEKKCGRSK